MKSDPKVVLITRPRVHIDNLLIGIILLLLGVGMFYLVGWSVVFPSSAARIVANNLCDPNVSSTLFMQCGNSWLFIGGLAMFIVASAAVVGSLIILREGFYHLGSK